MKITHVLTMFALGVSTAGAQQVPLSAADSASVTVAILSTLFDSVPIPSSGRTIWLRGIVMTDSITGRDTFRFPSDAQWQAIRQAYPNARLVDHRRSLYDCDPGVRPFLPVTGCSIYEGGIIVDLGELRYLDNEIRTSISVTQSERRHAWLVGLLDMVYVRSNGAWKLKRIGERVIT